MQGISQKQAQLFKGVVVVERTGNNINVVDMTEGTILQRIDLPYSWRSTSIRAYVSPTKRRMYAFSSNHDGLREYCVWDIGTATRLECSDELKFQHLEMSNSGLAMVTHYLEVWEVDSCTRLCSCWQEGLVSADCFGNRVGECKFSGDDSKIIALVGKKVFVCDAYVGALCYEFLGHGDVPVLAVASKNDICVSVDCVAGLAQGRYIVWEYSAGMTRYIFSSVRVTRLLFGADEETLFADDGQRVCGFRVSSGTQLFVRRYCDGVNSVVFSPTANTLIVSSRNTISIQDGAAGNVKSSFV
jgi:hypothetical protein